SKPTTAAGLLQLQKHPALRVLSLTKVPLDNDIASLTQLERLSLEATVLPPMGMAPIAKLPKLRELTVSKIGLSGLCMAQLAPMKNLFSLKLTAKIGRAHV